MAARSALSSLASNLASIAGDERGSERLERCITIGLTLPPTPNLETTTDILQTLEQTLASLLPYTEFLSINRYGSHVLQSLLSILPPLFPHLPPTSTVLQSLQAIAETLLPSLLEYATHIAGSHVLRSLICALGGIVPSSVLPKRGKGGKHKHSGSRQSQLPTTNTSTSYPQSVTSWPQPSMISALESMVRALVDKCGKKDRGYLQMLCCHSDAAPVIATAIRVIAVVDSKGETKESENMDMNKDANKASRTGELQSGSYPSVKTNGPGEALIRAILEADDAKNVGEVVYGLSGDKLGSFILEACLETYPITSNILYEHGVKGRVKEYVEDDVSNFVLQSMLQHLPDGRQDVVSEVIKSIKNGMLEKNRTGVLFRLVQYAGRTGVKKEDVYNAVFGNYTVSDILKIELPEKEGGRVKIDVNGARAVYWITNGTYGVFGEKVVEKGIKDLGSAEVIALVKDGMGSKLVVDGMLESETDKVRDMGAGLI